MSRGSKRIRALAVIVLLGLIAAFAALFIAPPRALTRQIAIRSSVWVMGDGPSSDGRVISLAKRLVTAYVQMSIAAQIAKGLASAEPDEGRDLTRVIIFVRGQMLTPHQYEQSPIPYPALVRGVGYCDQVNGAVAMVAARRFEKAEIYALRDPVTNESPHTIGRVWSAARGDWLYFDAFYSEVVVFTKGADGRPRFTEIVSEPTPSRGEVPKAIYALPGATLAGFPRTYGSFLLSRLLKPGQPQRAPVAHPAPRVTRASEGPAASPRLDGQAFDRMASAYVAARVDDLYGERSVAAYRRIAADPLSKRDPRAAAIAALARTIADVHESVTQ